MYLLWHFFLKKKQLKQNKITKYDLSGLEKPILPNFSPGKMDTNSNSFLTEDEQMNRNQLKLMRL